MTPFGPSAVLDQPHRAIVDQLGDEIIAFNFAAINIMTGLRCSPPFVDEDGKLAAGIYGWTWGGTAWIERLWIHARQRGRRLGTNLLAALEQKRGRGVAIRLR